MVELVRSNPNYKMHIAVPARNFGNRWRTTKCYKQINAYGREVTPEEFDAAVAAGSVCLPCLAKHRD